MITSPVRGERDRIAKRAKEGGKLIARERKKRGRVKKKKTIQKIGLVVRDYYIFCRTWYVPGKRMMRESAFS